MHETTTPEETQSDTSARSQNLAAVWASGICLIIAIGACGVLAVLIATGHSGQFAVGEKVTRYSFTTFQEMSFQQYLALTAAMSLMIGLPLFQYFRSMKRYRACPA
ncbi:hypothetical protein F4X86_01340 [Candidatus Saccharibacteria bacterium]|nr:hypothetical protein [Candidatus Saccharibacteria bacterium]